ncbi:MAG: winged helix-turn-helix transcriptional regulator [Halopseudomonas aestusnigri]
MDINIFVNITSRAWALPILAKLHSGIPGRQASLLIATGASRSAFTQSMEHLIMIGLLERNPGYGHPLRPEFRLTPVGQTAAVIANKILDVSEEEEQDLLRRSWTLPVLATLQKPSQFSEIKRNLLTISDRALSQSLQRMEDRSWVHRRVDNAARPPMPLYYPINTGAMISNVTSAVTLA